MDKRAKNSPKPKITITAVNSIVNEVIRTIISFLFVFINRFYMQKKY